MKNRRPTGKPAQKKHFIADIMQNGKFICQIKYEYCPLFKFDLGAVIDFIEKHKPSLQGQKYEVWQTDHITDPRRLITNTGGNR